MEDLSKRYRSAVLSNDLVNMMVTKQQILPPKLYRYRCFDAHWYSNIVMGKVYMGSPKHFNDPFDGTLHGYGKTLLHSVRKDASFPVEIGDFLVCNADGETQPFSDLLSKRIDSFKDMFRVACFSERLDSLPMWAHYAAHHTGYAIEYDLTKLSFDDSAAFYQVVYLSEDDMDALNCATRPPIPICVLLKKGTDWAYEKEWRIVKTHNEPAYIDLSNCISAVYLGAKFDMIRNQDEIAAIRDSLSSRNADLRKMYIENLTCSVKHKPL